MSLFTQHHDCLSVQDIILSSINDVANGMEYIHSKNIIHGDLK